MLHNNLLDDGKKNRIWELDFIRGFCILLMIIDHILYDLAFIFSDIWFKNDDVMGFWYSLCNLAEHGYFSLLLRDIIWVTAVFLFVFISGISCSFSHSNVKRGIRLLFVSLLLTVITWGMDWFMGVNNQYVITFGILHMLSVSILLYCILGRLGRKPILLIAIFIIVTGIYFSKAPLESSVGCLGVLVHTSKGFYSADYFPLFPWFGCFIMGASLGPLLYKNRLSLFPRFRVPKCMQPVLFVGRNSLTFYLLHQPVIYGILLLIGYVFIK